jgi:hypothetical protein
MAYSFIKFPKKFLETEEWKKTRKYTKTEALLYLLYNPELPSIRRLAMIWDWKKSTVVDFISYVREQGYLGQNSDKIRTQAVVNINELQDLGGQSSDKVRTHIIKEIKNPPILSSTKVESNIIPPKGERDFLQELDGEYQEIVREWLSYKRERKETYKSVRSMQAFVAKLTKLSQGNPRIAREIINQSMANNWAGIFQLKNYDSKPSTNTAGNAEPNEILEAVARGIARSRTPQEWQS